MACVPQTDLQRWCFDDASCCEGLRCNRVDGFCVGDEDGTTGTGADTDPPSTGTDTDPPSTGTDTDSSSETGTRSDTDTDTTTGA